MAEDYVFEVINGSGIETVGKKTRGCQLINFNQDGSVGWVFDATVYMGEQYAGSIMANAERRFGAGKFKRLTVYVSTNSVSSDTTYELWVNGAATGLTVTFAGAETGRKTATGDIDIADGDLVCVKEIVGTGTGQDGVFPKEVSAEFVGGV